MNIHVVIATYNERENIATLIPKVLSLREDITVLIIDDSSPDGTGELADEFSRDTGRVEVIHRREKLGLGTALKTGLKHAKDNGADLVATMDADHSHAPEYLPNMIDLAGEASLVVGSRYVAGGGVRNWGIRRIILSRTANFYARTVTGLHVRDCTTGYRVYRRDLLEKINLDELGSKGYSFLVEILYVAKKEGFIIREVPIIFKDRVKGQSKINIQEIAGGAWSLLKSRLKKSSG